MRRFRRGGLDGRRTGHNNGPWSVDDGIGTECGCRAVIRPPRTRPAPRKERPMWITMLVAGAMLFAWLV